MSNKKAILKLEDGREIEVEISEDELEQLAVRKSPYKRVANGKLYYADCFATINKVREDKNTIDNCYYKSINYYNDEEFAEKCIRADLLMRKLRKFAVENNLMVGNKRGVLFEIIYNKDSKDLSTAPSIYADCMGAVFNDISIAEKAIDEFHDELLWYFKEYRKIFI